MNRFEIGLSMTELWTKQCVILRDFEGLLKYEMIPMASIINMIVEDHKRYKKKQTYLKSD